MQLSYTIPKRIDYNDTPESITVLSGAIVKSKKAATDRIVSAISTVPRAIIRSHSTNNAVMTELKNAQLVISTDQVVSPSVATNSEAKKKSTTIPDVNSNCTPGCTIM